MAARFAVATGNWNDNNTWAASSGGAPGASFPTVADSATLDAASGNITVTVNVSSAALSLTCTGFTGTLVFNAQLSVSGSITLPVGGTLSGTTGPLVAHATGTLTSGGKTLPCPLTFDASATYTLADDWTVTGLVSVGVSSVSQVVNGVGRKITCNGGLHQAGTTSSVNGTCKFVVAGGTWDSSSTGAFNSAIDLQGGVTVSGSVTIGGTLTYVSGTITTTGSTLVTIAAGSVTLNTSGMAWNNVTFGNGSTNSLSSALAFSGTLAFANSAGITVSGAGAMSGTGAVTFSGTGTVTLSNTGGLTTTGTMTLPNASMTFAGSSGWTVGTLTTATLTLTRTHTLTFGNTYTVTTALSNVGAASTIRQNLVSSSPGNRVVFTVQSGATLSLAGCDPTDIDSSAGAQVLSVGASISNSLNWVGTLTAAGSYSGGGRIIGA